MGVSTPSSATVFRCAAGTGLRLDQPLPRLLDEARAGGAFVIAGRNLPGPLGRLMVTPLARTGRRRGELLGLTIDAIVEIGTVSAEIARRHG